MNKLMPVIVLLGLIAAGCATGYHKVGFTGGYSETKLQDDIFKVGFKGNAKCSLERAEDFTLLRSAEIAIENGYKYFVIIDEKSGTQTGAYTTPATATTSESLNMYGNTGSYSSTTNVYGGQTYIFHKPSVRNTIKCFKEKPDNIPAVVYDAEQIIKNIKARYIIK